MFGNNAEIEQLSNRLARIDADFVLEMRTINSLMKRLDGIEKYLGIEYNDGPVGYVEKVDGE